MEVVMMSAYTSTSHYPLSGAVNKLHDIEERIRRTEDSSKENKSALGKLMAHHDPDKNIISSQLS